MVKDKRLQYLIFFSTIFAILIIWQVSSLLIGESLILPSPIDTINTSFSLLGTGEFWLALLSTLGRSLIAFLLSFLIALLLANLVNVNKLSGIAIKTIVAILRAIPTIAIILLLLLWTNSKVASVVVTMLVVLPTIFNMTIVMYSKVDRDVLDMCKVFSVSKKNTISKYLIPVILPTMLQTIGSTMSLNIKLIVAAEVLAGTANSIGNMMSESKIYFEISRLFALVVIMILIAVAIELIFNLFAKKVSKKYGIN